MGECKLHSDSVKKQLAIRAQLLKGLLRHWPEHCMHVLYAYRSGTDRQTEGLFWSKLETTVCCHTVHGKCCHGHEQDFGYWDTEPKAALTRWTRPTGTLCLRRWWTSNGGATFHYWTNPYNLDRGKTKWVSCLIVVILETRWPYQVYITAILCVLFQNSPY